MCRVLYGVHQLLYSPTIVLLFESIRRQLQQLKAVSVTEKLRKAVWSSRTRNSLNTDESKESWPTRWWQRICYQSDLQYWNTKPDMVNEGKGVGYVTDNPYISFIFRALNFITFHQHGNASYILAWWWCKDVKDSDTLISSWVIVETLFQ